MAGSATMHDGQLFLAAANLALANTGDPAWDARFAEWLMLDGLLRANYAFGDMARANEGHDNAMQALEEEHGKNFRSVPEVQAARADAFEAIRAAEDRSGEHFALPMSKAAVALAETPSPNLVAALFKIELIKREELDNTTDMARDAMEIVIEDMKRLRRAV